tara:strand:- start:11237 stop:11893 length:657 start_codon:yes stop_codon:yes gene_type:complete
MNTLGQRIAHFRKKKNLSQGQLSELCGWGAQSRIGNYEKDNREPNLADLRKIAEQLSVSLAELLDIGVTAINEPSAGYDVLTAKEGNVPVVGKAELGADGFFEAMDYPPGHGDGVLLINSDDPNAYGLRVAGDSMHPRIKNGEFVLIEPNKPYCTGDEVMVRTSSGRSMIKEFIYHRDGMYRFDSVNQDHAPIHLHESDVEKIHLVGGILKSSRFFDT